MRNESQITLGKKIFLAPFSWIYGAIVILRNRLFDLGILKSYKFSLPVIITIGNITVGGTGKTPHTEYIINLLKDTYNIAMLSRGYKRKTKNFVLSDNTSTALTIGDEPFQVKQKFPKITVAVDADRIKGIEKLKVNKPKLDAIILDDAYQYRRLNAGLSILLIDYNRLIADDKLLPIGRLREPACNTDRADIIVITKCPKEIKPVDVMTTRKRIYLYPFQQLFFSSISYEKPKPIYPSSQDKPISLNKSSILAVSGIASNQTFYEHLQLLSSNLQTISFPDHHFFNDDDFRNIEQTFEKITGKNKIIIVTEKDKARLLANNNVPKKLKPYLYSIGIEIRILNNEKKKFDNQIQYFVKHKKKKGSL